MSNEKYKTKSIDIQFKDNGFLVKCYHKEPYGAGERFERVITDVGEVIQIITSEYARNLKLEAEARDAEREKSIKAKKDEDLL